MYALLAAVFVFVGSSTAAMAQERKFDGGRYNLRGNLWVVQELRGKINADEFEDTVRLVSERNKDTGKEERMWFEVQLGFPRNMIESRRPRPFIVPLPERVSGYNVQVELKNFIDSKTEEVFMTLDETAKGPRHFAVIQIRADDVRRDARFLFDSRTLARAILSGEFIGNFRATVRVDDTNTNALLDLSGRKAFYQKAGVFSESGKILRPVAIRAFKYDTIALGDRDEQGVTQLNATIQLYAIDETDHVGTVHCVMKYDSLFGFWRLMESRIEPAEGIAIAKSRTK